MKNMNDRKMGMMHGGPKSDAFFPEVPHYEEIMSAGEITTPKYPDTKEEIYRDQEQAVKASDKGRLASGYRH